MFGLLDTQDDVWLGDDNGPFGFATEEDAELARDVFCERLQWSHERLIVAPSEECHKIRDSVTPQKSLEEALDNMSLRQMAAATGIHIDRLRRIEKGGVIQSREEDRKIREYLKL